MLSATKRSLGAPWAESLKAEVFRVGRRGANHDSMIIIES